MRTEGLDLNFEHLVVRARERLKETEVVRVAKIFQLLAARCKERKLPNSHWYRSVTDESGRILAHICGTGSCISTVLSGDMAPHGQKI